MIAPDHDCSWTRGRRSVLRRVPGGLWGAGLPRAVLEAAARRLDLGVSAAEPPEDEYTEAVTVGPWRATLHDGCFLHLETDAPEARSALLAAALELHEGYLGTPLGAAALAAANAALAQGAELLLESIPRRRELRLRAYPAAAGWLRRRLAPVTRIQA